MAGRSGVIIAEQIGLHSDPADRTSVIRPLPRGTAVEIVRNRDGWYEVDGPLGRGWVE